MEPHRIWRYLRENWGALPLIAFVGLLLVASVELDYGLVQFADTTGMYAFYLLVAGIVLQIASSSWRSRRSTNDGKSNVRISRNLAILLAILIVSAGSGAVAYDYVVTHGFHAPLVASVGYVDELPESGGTTVVAFSILANGSVAPYSFQVRWGDGTIQNSTTGAFSRAFAGGTVPGYVTATVTGGDGQRESLTIQLAASSASTTTTTSSSNGTGAALSTSSSFSSQASTAMSATVGYVKSINGSGGAITVLFGIDVHGGTTPYNFVAKWADGVVQTSAQGTFTRTFTSGTIPATVYVTIISADGQTTAVNVTIPPG